MDSKHCLKTAHKMLHKGSRKHQTLQKVELDIEVFKRLDKDEYNTYRIWLLLDCDRTSDSKILINEDLRKWHLLDSMQVKIYKAGFYCSEK
jgi:hypothetical protein